MHKLTTLFAIATCAFRDRRNFKRGLAAAMVGALGLAIVAPANATVIEFYNDASTLNTHRFTLGCGSASGDCSGLAEALFDFDTSPLGNPTWSPTTGDVFDIPGSSNPADETAFVNSITGESFSTGTQNSGGGSGTVNFSTSAEYVLFKIGNKGGVSYALLHNTDSALDLFFDATSGTGSGLSHYTVFGMAPATDVPAPNVLALMALGLLMIGVGLGFSRGRI